MSKRDVFKVLGCEGEPPLRKVTLEAWLQEEDACEYVPGSTVTLEFIGRQMPDPEATSHAAPHLVVNTSDTFKAAMTSGGSGYEFLRGETEVPVPADAESLGFNDAFPPETDADHNGN